MTYEELLEECSNEGLEIFERDMINKGLYCDGVVAINKKSTNAEKKCILSEEIGHYKTSIGNILDQTKLENIKQENIARAWGYKKLMPLTNIIKAYKYGCKNKSEIAEYLDITEEYFLETLEYYKLRFGLFCHIDNMFTITFEPLGVYKRFN